MSPTPTLTREHGQDVLDGLRPGQLRKTLITTLIDDLQFKAKDLAGVSSVAEQTIRNWKTSPGTELPPKLDDLRTVAELLVDSEAVSPELVGAWFRARNRDLEYRRPLEAIEQGEFQEVLHLAERSTALVAS